MSELQGKVVARNVMLGTTTNDEDTYVKLEVKEKLNENGSGSGEFEGTMVATGFGDHQIGDGNSEFTNDILLNLGNDTKNSVAWSMMDTWLKRHLIAPPPAPSNGQIVREATTFTISWTNPERVELGFLDQEVPYVDEVVVKMRIQDDNVSLENRQLDSYWSSAITINTSSRDCTALKLLTDGTTNALVGNTYHLAGVISPYPTIYDFRVYGVNKNGGMNKNYYYIWDGGTTPIGPPTEPRNLTQTNPDSESHYRSITMSYSSPLDHDTITDGSQTVPPIEAYNITWEWQGNRATGPGLNRFDNSTYTSGKDGSSQQSGTTMTLSNIYPFSRYNVTVKARNTQNNTWSNEQGPPFDPSDNPTVEMLTAIPPNAGPMSSASHNTFSSSYKQSISSPRFLDGTSAPNESGSTTNIVKHASIGSAFVPNLDNSSSIATFHADHACAISAVVSKFTMTMSMKDGATGPAGAIDTVTHTIGGFGTTGNNRTETGNNSHVRVIVSLDTDKNDGDQYASGFWKTCDVSTAFGNVDPVHNTATIQNKPSLYKVQLEQELLGSSGTTLSTITCSEMGFYVDSLFQSPVVVNPCIYAVEGTDRIAQVCGADTYKNGTTFHCQSGLQHVCGYFLRGDLRHLHVQLRKDGSSNTGTGVYVTRGSANGGTYYYDAPPNPYARLTNKHNGTGTELNPNASDIYWEEIKAQSESTDFYSEDVSVRINGYNTVGEGSNVIGRYRDPTGTELKIRFDTVSLTMATSTLVNPTGGNGQLVFSGSTDFPSINNISPFDHTQSLVSTYSSVHQLVNGKFYGPGGSYGFLNYGTLDYHWSAGTSNAFDYSGATGTGYRWTTFKFTRTWSLMVNKLNLTLNGASGFVLDLSDPTLNNHKMYLYDPGLGLWLDTCAAIPAIGLTGAMNGHANALAGTTVYNRLVQTSSLGGTQTYYIRIGWPNDQANCFSSVSIAEG